MVEGLSFVAEAERNEEFKEECDAGSVKLVMSEVLISLVDPSFVVCIVEDPSFVECIVEDPINVVFLVVLEPLLVEELNLAAGVKSDDEVGEELEIESVVKAEGVTSDSDELFDGFDDIFILVTLEVVTVVEEDGVLMNFDEPSLLVEWVANDGVLADIVDSVALVDPSFVA